MPYGCGSKLKEPGIRRFESLVPFTKVPFWFVFLVHCLVVLLFCGPRRHWTTSKGQVGGIKILGGGLVQCLKGLCFFLWGTWLNRLVVFVVCCSTRGLCLFFGGNLVEPCLAVFFCLGVFHEGFVFFGGGSRRLVGFKGTPKGKLPFRWGDTPGSSWRPRWRIAPTRTRCL